MKYSLCLVTTLLFINTSKAQVNHPSVNIGSQTWMAKNLDVSTYRNGDPIPEVKDTATWSKLTTGAWCYYNNDPAMGAIYGKLYNWYAVNDPRVLAPAGWHVSSDDDWTILVNYLGGSGIAGSKMREAGTKHWNSPNEDATNSSGFTALPGGTRYYNGPFSTGGYYGLWWSSTEFNTTGAWHRYLYYNYGGIGRYYYGYKRAGYSVRCLRD